MSHTMDWATLVEGVNYKIDTYNVDISKDYVFCVYRILNIIIIQFDFFNNYGITPKNSVDGVLQGLPKPIRSFMRNAGILATGEGFPIGVSAAGTLGFWQLPKSLPAASHLMGSLAYVASMQ